MAEFSEASVGCSDEVDQILFQLWALTTGNLLWNQRGLDLDDDAVNQVGVLGQIGGMLVTFGKRDGIVGRERLGFKPRKTFIGVLRSLVVGELFNCEHTRWDGVRHGVG